MGGFSDNYASAAVFEKEAVIGGFVQRIDRDRNRADAHRAEESHRERRTIAQREQYPIFSRGAERPQRARHCAYAIEEVFIRDPLIAEIDRRFLAATRFEIGVN